MAEETPAAAAAPAPPVGENGEAKKKREYKRDETPIEELFDLSQPLPRVRTLSFTLLALPVLVPVLLRHSQRLAVDYD
jgi:hypothetical protein